jgi:hypothetical protein
VNVKERRAATALKLAERPDVTALRYALNSVERNFNDVLALQDEEIRRLRVIVVATVRAYRMMAAAGWKGSRSKFNKFTEAMDTICLESDAIEMTNDLAPKRRPVPKRG